MEYSLVDKIREHAVAQKGSLPFPPVREASIGETEKRVGFLLPTLLKQCYLRIGNGGFGPGYGIIGLTGGFASDHGTLVDTYETLKRDQESEGKKWEPAILPFCDWGCNIFSCVDCNGPRNRLYVFEDFDAWPQRYNLDEFFKMWIDGVDILAQDELDSVEAEIVNPFTGKKTHVTRRRRK